MEFEKIKHTKFKRKSSRIADQILKMIKAGEYRVGFKLPAERTIAEQMGVSRPSVREAISALQIVGILESRPGDGSYVAEPSEADNLISQAFKLLEDSDSPFEVLQTRKALEIGVVLLAIKLATKEDIRAIKMVWQKKYEKGRDGEYKDFILLGRDFHLAIARATKSESIVSSLDKLIEVNHRPLWVNMREAYFKQNPNQMEIILKTHDNLVKAIEERNSQEAIRFIEEHFDLNIKQLYFENDNM